MKVLNTVVSTIIWIVRRLLQTLSVLLLIGWSVFVLYQLFSGDSSNDDEAVILFVVCFIVPLFLAGLFWWLASELRD